MEMEMTDSQLSSESILVLGGTGKTGRRVAERLMNAGHAVRIGSRSAEPRFDWDDQATWAPALQGVKAVYIAYQPDLAVPEALPAVRAFFDRAIEAGATRLVLLSGRGEVEAEECEAALQATSAEWTILRASWFNQNFSENFWLDGVLAGEIALPVSDVAEPFVDADDIADIAFAALTQTGHEFQLYEITGPRALSFPEAIAEIAAATGRDIRFTRVPAEAYAAELTRLDMPANYVDLVMYLLTTVLDGRNTPLADGVQRALGRPPIDFSDYVRRTAATGIWSA
jgi:uncharacterized protein YbjT (DUF2867 family)